MLGLGSKSLVVGLATLLFATAASAFLGPDERWDERFFASGLDGGVRAMAVDGTDLYVTGDFQTINDVSARFVAKWDGASWSPLGTGLDGLGRAIAVFGGDVIVGGNFASAGDSPASNLARWDGSSWHPFGTGADGPVVALAVAGGNLYAAGSFTQIDGVAANRIAKWNGTSWSPLGAGTNAQINAVVVNGSDLYAGGLFTTAGGSAAARVARWDGSSWSTLGAGVNASVGSLLLDGSDLYVGGDFTTAGGAGASHIARWNGTTWSTLGAGANNAVTGLAKYGSDIYAGGQFTSIGGSAIEGVAKWNGSSWSSIEAIPATPSGRNVLALAFVGSNLFIGGSFGSSDGVAAENLAEWTGATWSSVGRISGGLGVNDGEVRGGLVVSANEVYLGGNFGTVGGIGASRIVRWDGAAWSTLGSGICCDDVIGFAGTGNDLYVGGTFATAGGVSASNIAHWDGSVWSALGTGTNAPVLTLSLANNLLYAGGYFSSAGGVPASRVAAWDGSHWSALGLGLDANVLSSAVYGSNVLMAGDFYMSGSERIAGLAEWKVGQQSWWRFDIPRSAPPYSGGSYYGEAVLFTAVATSGDDIYAAGYFFNPIGNPFEKRVAKWTNSGWVFLGPKFDGTVDALLVDHGNLYAGGSFATAGGVAAANLAKWNGTVWSPIGKGTDRAVRWLAANDHQLYVGGQFSTAGDASSRGFAIWSSVCGDMSVEVGEDCDDGNLDDTDGCKNDCTANICGDGVPYVGTEECDDGNGLNGDGCDQNCTLSDCGNGVLAAPEVCEDNNTVDGDGCDGNCTITACGNGVASPSTGEACDDGNAIDGDGCQNNCTLTPVSVVLPPGGGTVTTDPGAIGATRQVPTQVSLATMTGGLVAINSTTSTVVVNGYQFVGIPIQIEAPTGSEADPLLITLTLDQSAIPPFVDGSHLEALRDASPIDDCTHPTFADPDPCLQSLTLVGDDYVFVIRSAHASLWQLAVRGLDKTEQGCVNGMNTAGVKVAKAQAKSAATCLKNAAKGAEADPQACLSADIGGKVAKSFAGTTATQGKKCSVPPDFGWTGDAVVNAAAVAAETDLVAAVFGDDLSSVVRPSSDKAGSSCQAAVLKATQKLFETRAKLFLGCKKDALKGKNTPMAVSAPQLGECFAAVAVDPKGKIAKALSKLTTALESECAEVVVPSVLPVTCFSTPTPTACIDVHVKCLYCRMFDTMDNLGADCDQVDDGIGNESCP